MAIERKIVTGMGSKEVRIDVWIVQAQCQGDRRGQGAKRVRGQGQITLGPLAPYPFGPVPVFAYGAKRVTGPDGYGACSFQSPLLAPYPSGPVPVWPRTRSGPVRAPAFGPVGQGAKINSGLSFNSHYYRQLRSHGLCTQTNLSQFAPSRQLGIEHVK